jgi:hypothetical protein
MSDIVLLESDLAKLTKDRLIYGFGKKEQTILISDIKRASLSSGFFSLPELVLEFKDGTEKEFVVGTASGLSRFTDLMSGMSNQSDQDMINSTQQWVTTINMLLAMR